MFALIANRNQFQELIEMFFEKRGLEIFKRDFKMNHLNQYNIRCQVIFMKLYCAKLNKHRSS